MNVCLMTSWLSFNSNDYHACPVCNKSGELDCRLSTQLSRLPKCTLLFLQIKGHTTELLSTYLTNSKKMLHNLTR